MPILLKAGRLVSTSDMRLARKLQKLISVSDITGGAQPVNVRETREAVSFMFGGEFYELSKAGV